MPRFRPRLTGYPPFLLASLFANVGSFVHQLVQPWLLLSLGASAPLIGVDAFARSAPIWLLAGIGGRIADCGQRRQLVATVQVVAMAALMVAAVWAHAGRGSIAAFIAISLIVGCADGLAAPALSIAIVGLVGQRRLVGGLALNAVQ